MSRILLIKSGNLTRLNYAVTFPLGIMYIASVLKNNGHEVKIVDTRLYKKMPDFKKIINDFEPQIAGLSALTIESEKMHQIAREIKKVNNKIKIIAGGPHPTSYPEDTLKNDAIDFVVSGEGERTIIDLISSLNNGYHNIPGICYRNGTIRKTGEREPINNLDELPFPAWDLVDINKYSRRLSMSMVGFRRYMGIFTSRACPYRCIYCHKMFGKRFRARSPENVISEIEMLVHNYGINDFEIYDDIFNFNRARTEKIMDLLIEKKLNVHLSFPNGLRTDLLDFALLEKMKKAGVYYISIAVETASERLQKHIKKNLNLKKVNEMINHCAELGIFTRGFFMLGFPTETEEELRKTIKFAIKSKLHTAYFFIVTPFKGTEMGDSIKNSENIPYRDYDYFTGYFNLSNISARKLFFYQIIAWLLFNLNPYRIYLVFRDFKRKRSMPILLARKIVDFFKSFVRGN
jgi:radical SAM superfamily enzyme YgiQ (UPF0313 family)